MTPRFQPEEEAERLREEWGDGVADAYLEGLAIGRALRGEETGLVFEIEAFLRESA